ncbi:MAG: ATP-binding protein [Myxococcales bacterium]|nr:ATP-binding protein [Myxococcales bacterium]MCB9749600.1 ATP-binding protein [Myxococcales bacterium]
MADDIITEEQLAKTEVSLTCSVRPIANVMCDLSAILANSVDELLRAFYPAKVGKRANILITELVNNVLENMLVPESEIKLEVALRDQQLVIRVYNAVPEERYAQVKAHVDAINEAPDVRKLLKATIRARRAQRAKGGLGLIRVVAENKFRITTDYQGGTLCVESVLSLGDMP